MKKLLLASMMLMAATSGAMAKPRKDKQCVGIGIVSLGFAYLPGNRCNT